MGTRPKMTNKYSETRKRWRQAHPNYDKDYFAIHQNDIKEYKKQWWKSHQADSLKTRFNRLKKNAKNRGIVFEIDLDYLTSLGMKCGYTGIDLTLDRSKFNTISYDRIDNNKGYIIGNVAPCCVDVNEMKRKMSKEDLITWCKRIVKYTESKEQ